MNKIVNMFKDKGWKLLFSPNGILGFNLAIIIVLVMLLSLFLVYPEGDIIEHIRASFLVSEGKVPYRDFFEHHNPLLWYLFADFIKLFYGSSKVMMFANFSTLLFFLIGVWFLYKIIVEFLGNKTSGLLSVILVLLPGVWLYYIYFKPDNYMLVCLCIGIYYLFCYFRDKKRKDLVISFVCFAVGFLFLQKILLFLPSIGLVILYYIYKKEIKLSDFGVAFGWGMSVIGLGVLWLWQMDLFGVYYKSCFEFNRELVKHAGENGLIEPTDFDKLVFLFAFVFGGCILGYKDKYFRIWYFIGLFCLATKVFYFSPHWYYFYEVFFFASVILMVSLMELAVKNKLLLWVVVLQMQLYVIFMANCFLFDLVKGKQSNIQRYILHETNDCDYVFASSFNGNLWRKDIGYYWFLLGETDVIGQKVGIRNKDDFNKLIEEKKPKLVFVSDIYDRFLKLRKKEVKVHEFDWEMINKYYDRIVAEEKLELGKDNVDFALKVGQGGVFKLKSKYHKDECNFDESVGEWKYAED